MYEFVNKLIQTIQNEREKYVDVPSLICVELMCIIK